MSPQPGGGIAEDAGRCVMARSTAGWWQHGGVLKAPAPDPSIDQSRQGVFVLRRDGEVVGHVASVVSTYWSPSRP